MARIEAEDAERALVTALAIQVGNAVAAMPEAAQPDRESRHAGAEAPGVATERRQFPRGLAVRSSPGAPGCAQMGLGM